MMVYVVMDTDSKAYYVVKMYITNGIIKTKRNVICQMHLIAN